MTLLYLLLLVVKLLLLDDFTLELWVKRVYIALIVEFRMSVILQCFPVINRISEKEYMLCLEKEDTIPICTPTEQNSVRIGSIGTVIHST